MIKLSRNFTPMFFNPTNIQELTEEFIESGKNVWNIDEVKKPLLKISYFKCAYCECKVDVESNYLEVEHFKDKNRYPNKVLEWNNLLPSCKRCNGSKGTHDVNHEMIINPCDEDPRDHFFIDLYRLKNKSYLGENSIDILDLNNTERVVFKRFEIGEAILNSLNDALEKLKKFEDNGSTRSKNRIQAHLESLLKECIPKAQYSATSATVLHNQKIYSEIRNKMIVLNIWADYLEEMHKSSINIKL